MYQNALPLAGFGKRNIVCWAAHIKNLQWLNMLINQDAWRDAYEILVVADGDVFIRGGCKKTSDSCI